jgi:hypothetical protein
MHHFILIKYFYKDLLITNYKISPSSSGPNKTHYIFYGYCKSDSIKSRIEISFSIVEDGDKYFDQSNIPIWRTKLTNFVFYRNKNSFHKPFSYYMRNYWLGTIMSILFLPCLIYLIYLKKFKKMKI